MRSLVDSFRGPHRFLSNTYPAPLEYGGRGYPSSEYAFQAAKAADPEDRDWVTSADRWQEAKRRGRSIRLRPGWEEGLKYDAMYEIVLAKFTQHRDIASLLLETGRAELVEGNNWHDQVWGDCECGRPACDAPGQNSLGAILERVREEVGFRLCAEYEGLAAAQRAVEAAPPARLLVTGSRDWTDSHPVSLLLSRLPDDAVLVHGAARGLDSIAAEAAERLGLQVESHPADWERRGRGAGFQRNQEMVNLGAEMCLAFPVPGSRGTVHCSTRAERDGIPTYLVWGA